MWRICGVLWFLIFGPFSLEGQFRNITQSSGLNHTCRSGSLIGGGGAFIDINKDGWLDMVLTGGTDPDRVYINQRNQTFSVVC